MSDTVFSIGPDFIEPGKQELLSLLIRYSPAAIAVFDTQMRYIAASEKWVKDYGLSRIDFKGMSHYDIFPEIRRMTHWVESHQYTLAGNVYTAECDRFERFDGTVQYVRYELRPWYDKSGEVGGLIMFTQVITDEVLQKQELERQRRFLNRAQQIAHVGYWRLDTRYNELFWSEEVYAIHGLDPLTFKPTIQNALKAYHPRDRAVVEEMIEEAVEQKASFDFRLRLVRPGGEIRLVRAHGECECDADGNVIGVFGVFKDITEDRLPQYSLRAATVAA